MEPGTTQAALRWLWVSGLGDAVRASIGGLPEENGKRVLLVPPAPPEELTPSERKALAPWICRERDPRCGRAKSYVARAEQVFDAAQAREHATADFADCANARSQWSDPKPTAFEAWALCVTSAAPTTYRYPRLPLRGPERGWLVLGGRRGHYAFSDDLGAYDLVTGAAYVARSKSRLVLGERSVDFAATDAQRKTEKRTGTVAVDQLRELAFVLVTATAVKQARADVTAAPLPDGMALELTPGEDEHFGTGTSTRDMWGSSGQTEIAYTILDGGVIRASGSFMWPDSADPAEAHADRLVRVLEAGFVEGCAPAALPKRLRAAASGGVSHLDADPRRERAVYAELDATLDALRANVCPKAAR